MRVIYSAVELLPNPTTGNPYTKEEGRQILKHLERAARQCYQSQDKITADSAARMLRSVVDRGHESVIEHYAISLRFTVDRGVSHELVRHRIASFSQESTRYCNYSNGKFGENITYIDPVRGFVCSAAPKALSPSEVDELYAEWHRACEDAEKHYFKLLELGAAPQMARQVLNNSTKTSLDVTMNPRSWRNFCRLRCDKAAHPMMQEVAEQALEHLYWLLPPLFEDIYKDVFWKKFGEKAESNG